MHYRQSILCRGPKINNDVPMKIKSLNKPESFKYNFIKSLLLQYVYLGEFYALFFMWDVCFRGILILDIMSH